MSSRRIKPKKLLASEIYAEWNRKEKRFLKLCRRVLADGPRDAEKLVEDCSLLGDEDFSCFLPVLLNRLGEQKAKGGTSGPASVTVTTKAGGERVFDA